MARRRPSEADVRTAAASQDTTSVTSGAPTWHVERGPYLTELGMLATCPVHHWSGPNLSIIDGSAAVCWETGHVWDEGDALRAAR